MKFENFDLNMESHLKKLCKIADKTFPERNWFIEVKFWQDTDFEIALMSCWGEFRDVFSYQKSINKYIYRQQKIRGFETTKQNEINQLNKKGET